MNIEKNTREKLIEIANEFLQDCSDLYLDEFLGVENDVHYNSELFNVETGASKIVLMPREIKDYVIKIPARGMSCHFEDEDGNESSGFEEYCSAPTRYEEDCWNYCQAEVEIYEDAVANGVEDAFAETEFLFRTNAGVPVYVQERVSFSSFHKQSSLSREEVSEKLEEVYSKSGDEVQQSCQMFNTEYAVEMLEYYGLSKFVKLMNFVYNENLNDFHSGNIGFNVNLQPILFDYSGFQD
jgi:hypothetical protein